MQDFGNALKHAIDASGLTQRHIAGAAGIKPQYLAHLLSGAKQPGPVAIAGLLRAFKTEPVLQTALLKGYLAHVLREVSKAANGEVSVVAAIESMQANDSSLVAGMERLPEGSPEEFLFTLNEVIRHSHRDAAILNSVEQLLRSALTLRTGPETARRGRRQ